jgi:hypothetical protein
LLRQPPSEPAVKPNCALLFDQLPLARSLERHSTPAVGIEHVTLVIGYYNNTPTTLINDFNHLAKKITVCSIVVDPLLAYKKTNSNSETFHAASDNRDHGKMGVIDSRNDLINGSRLQG